MIRLLIAITCTVLASAFAFAYVVQYHVWRACFNELGRCYDDENGVVYLEQSGMVWGGLTIVFAIAAAYQLWRYRRQRRITMM